MNGRRWMLVIGLLLLTFWLALWEITTLPLVHEDESWIAAHAWGLAHEGVFGAEMFSGLYGMESKTYAFMPVYALIESVIFVGAGLSLLTTRLVTVLAGVVTVALTLHIGRRNFGFQTAVLAAALLLGWRIAGPLPNRLFGIPLIDTARVARYDALVPVFGLLAWSVYQTAVLRNQNWRFWLAGLLTGVAGLTHIFGAFWLAVLLLLGWRDGRWRRGWPHQGFLSGSLMVFGFGLPVGAYLLYIASGFEAWQGQFNGIMALPDRFSPVDPQWYLNNLIREPLRYLPTLLGEEGWAALLRPGVALLLVGLPTAVFWLWRCGGRQGRALLIPLLVLPLLFGLLIAPKVPAYLITFWPVAALALAVFIVQAGFKAGGWRRLLVVALLGLALVEGGWQLGQTGQWASEMTSYEAYTGAIAANLPPEGLVIGLHRTWLGLAERDYRSWSVPIFTRAEPTPEGLAAALEGLEPTAVIIDSDMRAYFEERPAEWAAVESWLRERGFGIPAIVADGTYGRTAVYSRPASGGHR